MAAVPGMANLLLAGLLNVAFWSGIGLLVSSRMAAGWIDRLLATAVIGMVSIVLSLELLSLGGQINRASVATVCLVTAALGLFVWLRRAREQPVADRAGSGSRGPANAPWSILPPVAIGLAALVALVHGLTGLILPVEPVSDAPIYHLPFAIRWWTSGSLGLVPAPFGEAAATYYPANGELWLTWLLATGSDALAKVGQWPFMMLGGVAVCALARCAQAPWPTAVLPAAIWIALPIVAQQSSVANVDVIWTAFYLIAVYFLWHWLNEDSPDEVRSLFLFALASGIVIGAKALGAVFVALLLLPVMARLHRRRRWLRQVVVLTAGLLLPAGYWYLRNVILTGNPLYPLQLSLFGVTLTEGWYGASAMDATAYHLPVTAWRTFAARLQLTAGSVGLALVGTGLVTGWILSLRSSRAPASWAPAMCSTLALLHGVVYWFVVPYNTQERFLLPAFALALVPLARLAAARPVVQAGLCLALVWHLLAVSGGGQWHLGGAAMWLIVALPVAIAATWMTLQRFPRAQLVLAGLVVLVCAYAAVRPVSTAVADHPIARFYPHADFGARLFPGWEILERAARPTGSTVAYAGTNLPYYLLGVGLRNQVHYININGDPDWLPHDYHHQRLGAGTFRLADDPFPQWHRAQPDFNAWVANLRSRRIEFLFVARENRHGRLERFPGVLPPFPIEREWADAHPALFVDLGPFQYPPDTIPWVRVYRFGDHP
jgi:hypothetical protein